VKRWNVIIDLLKDRPHAAGAEIGVKEGRFSARLLAALPGLRTLYCVDAWQCYPDYELDRVKPGDEWPSQRMLDKARRQFQAVVARFPGRVSVLEMLSIEAAGRVPDGALDFVFIDANHLYEYVCQDIRLWLPKLKPGGLMAGHDYCFPVAAWGVQRAVDEAFGDSVETGPDYTWWSICPGG
jgi:hypothetical protein